MTAANIIITVLGGLALFLFGMKTMSDGLQKVAGPTMRIILSKMTGNRFSGVITGTLITSMIQSSSATTVMLISFVSAELLTLTQAVGVVMGANIGTTMTGWIVALFGFMILPTVCDCRSVRPRRSKNSTDMLWSVKLKKLTCSPCTPLAKNRQPRSAGKY